MNIDKDEVIEQNIGSDLSSQLLNRDCETSKTI